VAGVDKFTNILVDWTRYTSPLAARVLPGRAQRRHEPATAVG
jgi:hypothetical protein